MVPTRPVLGVMLTLALGHRYVPPLPTRPSAVGTLDDPWLPAAVVLLPRGRSTAADQLPPLSTFYVLAAVDIGGKRWMSWTYRRSWIVVREMEPPELKPLPTRLTRWLATTVSGWRLPNLGAAVMVTMVVALVVIASHW